MAYTPVMSVPFKLTAEDMGAPRDLAGSLMKGYDAAFKPKNLAEELLAKQLENKMNRPKAEDAQGWYDIEKSLKNAMLNHYLAQNEGLGLANNQSRIEGQQQQNFMDLMSGKAPSPGIGHYEKGGWIGPQAAGSGTNYYSNEADSAGLTPYTNEQDHDLSEADKGNNPEGFNVPEITSGDISDLAVKEGVNQGKPVYQKQIENVTAPSGSKTILSEGNANLEHLNKLYDENPQYRAMMEKRGIKKTQTIKLDPKTGNASILTQYPNGRIEIYSPATKGPKGVVGEPLTTAARTDLQKKVNAANKLLPEIHSLAAKGAPNQLKGMFGTNEQKAYESEMRELKEGIMTIFGWPRTNEALREAETLVHRGKIETQEAYQKRLINLEERLRERALKDQSTLNAGVILPVKESEPSSPSNKFDFSKYKKVGA